MMQQDEKESGKQISSHQFELTRRGMKASLLALPSISRAVVTHQLVSKTRYLSATSCIERPEARLVLLVSFVGVAGKAHEAGDITTCLIKSEFLFFLLYLDKQRGE